MVNSSSLFSFDVRLLTFTNWKLWGHQQGMGAGFLPLRFPCPVIMHPVKMHSKRLQSAYLDYLAVGLWHYKFRCLKDSWPWKRILYHVNYYCSQCFLCVEILPFNETVFKLLLWKGYVSLLRDKKSQKSLRIVLKTMS